MTTYFRNARSEATSFRCYVWHEVSRPAIADVVGFRARRRLCTNASFREQQVTKGKKCVLRRRAVFTRCEHCVHDVRVAVYRCLVRPKVPGHVRRNGDFNASRVLFRPSDGATLAVRPV
jgi:hypothetical protein